MKVIYCNRWFLSRKIAGITLLPFGVYINKNHIDYRNHLDRLLRHEAVHVEQIKRIGRLKFYITYLWKHKEYEREAYARQGE